MSQRFHLRIISVDDVSRRLEITSEQDLYALISEDPKAVSIDWLQTAHIHLSAMSIEEHFDELSYYSDYILYLRDREIKFSLETVKQIEDVQRIYTSARSSNERDIFIPEKLSLGLQNWFLLHLAMEKNPGSISKNFTTYQVERLADFVSNHQIRNIDSDFVLEHIRPFLNLPKGYLTFRGTAVGKYANVLFKRLGLSVDRRLISDMVLFGKYISESQEKSIDSILKSFFVETYRLMLMLKDLKVL